MEPHKSLFNRILLVILVLLYLFTVAVFSYTEWAANPEFTQVWMILLNIPILSIPLLLLCGSIYVLVVAWRERTAFGQVSPRLAKIIHWAPRIASILIILFISLFSLDVFEMEASPLELLGGFLMHNIPSILLIVMLVFAWRRPVVGFVAFLAAAALFTIFFVRNLDSLPALLLVVFPILLIALLFYADWKWVELQPPVRIDKTAQM